MSGSHRVFPFKGDFTIKKMRGRELVDQRTAVMSSEWDPPPTLTS